MPSAIRPLFGQKTPPSDSSLTRSVQSENGMGQHYTDPNHPVVRRAVRLARETGAKDVLELGAGRGLVSRAVAREASPERVLATDINEVGLQAIKSQAEGRANGRPVQTDVFNVSDRLPLPWWKAFDVVVAKDVYPFLNPQGATRLLKNAATALKANGYFLFSAPRLESRLGQDSQQTIPTNPYYRRLSEQARGFIQTSRNYFSFVTDQQIKRKLDQVGLDVKETQTFGRENGWLMVLAQKRPSKIQIAPMGPFILPRQ